MQPQDALDELMTLSSQLEDVALLGDSGAVLASSCPPEQAERLARVAADLLEAAAGVRPSGVVSRVQVELGANSVVVVVEGGRTAVATTIAEPTAGLVVYDLRTALRRLAEAPAVGAVKPKRKGKADA